MNTNAAEPWTFGEAVTEIARNFVGLRYRLLPYLYSCFYEATQSGMPVLRSLAIDYTFDSKVYDMRYQNQFLFGPSILILPYRGDARFGEAYFPPGRWYCLFTDEVEQGGEEKVLKLHFSRLPVFVKEGSIIPMQSLIQSTAEVPEDILYLHVYYGEENSLFVYYEDDGETYDYQNGTFYRREISYEANSKIICIGKSQGSFPSKFRLIKLILHGFSAKRWMVNGKGAPVVSESVSFIEPISHFDPHESPNPRISVEVFSLTFHNEPDDIVVAYE